VNSTRQDRIPQLVAAEKTDELPSPSLAAPRFTISEFAELFGFDENAVRERVARGSGKQEYYSIRELAERWRVSRGTVYNRLRSAGAKVLDFAAPGGRSKKAVRASVVSQIEATKTKKLC
jgi:transposase